MQKSKYLLIFFNNFQKFPTFSLHVVKYNLFINLYNSILMHCIGSEKHSTTSKFSLHSLTEVLRQHFVGYLDLRAVERFYCDILDIFLYMSASAIKLKTIFPRYLSKNIFSLIIQVKCENKGYQMKFYVLQRKFTYFLSG